MTHNGVLPKTSKMQEKLFVVSGCTFATVLFNNVVFFLKFLLDTCPFVGPLIPLFWTSGDVSSGFQSQSGQPHLNLAEVYMIYIPGDSPLVKHLCQCIMPA